MKSKGIDILSIEAKDIYMANMIDANIGYFPRYAKGKNKNKYNLNRFINTFDYSLDLIKVREEYYKKYRNKRFSFHENGHEYSIHIINVTFKYGLNEFNKANKTIYVKLGYRLSDIESLFDDGSVVINGELIAIDTDREIQNPLGEDILGRYFLFDEATGHYVVGRNKKVMTPAQLREKLYKDGFNCDGIHFVRFKRSSGSARVGKCLFINEALYGGMHKWELCGLDIKQGDTIDLAAFEAYISLTTSSIIDTLEIRPENILLIDDYESVFSSEVIETRLNDNNELETIEDETEISNSIWDGQSLMDISLFGKYSDKGMLLLRNQFFKSCAFNANIQKWFADNGVTDVSQLNGYTRAKSIEDVLLITTPNSVKYLKFGTFDDWLNNISPVFGVVKYDKPTHYFEGRLVQTHYQLLNTLQMNEDDVHELLKESFDFLDAMKKDPAVFRYYIKYPYAIFQDIDNVSEIATKNDIIYTMLGINDNFQYTKLYKDFLSETCKAFYKNMRKGHIFVQGNYSTICGNPIEMLQSAIGKFNGESQIGVGNVHSLRFPYDEDILASRSPHVTMGNVLVHRNVANEMIDTYMNPTETVIYINSIDENILMQLAGADFDSDTILITNNKVLLRCAKKGQSINKFRIPTCDVESMKRKRLYNYEHQADLDIKTSGNSIGEIINLSQELNTLYWDKLRHGSDKSELKQIYTDACQLSVMSGLEIDRAKKEFTFSNTKELNKMRAKYLNENEEGMTVKPYFFSFIQRYKGYYDPSRFEYRKHHTTMDLVECEINRYVRKRKICNDKTVKFADILVNDTKDKINYEQVGNIINKIEEYKRTINGIYTNINIDTSRRFQLMQDEKENLIDSINKYNINTKTVCYLLKLLDRKSYRHIYKTLFSIMFAVKHMSFFNVIKRSRDDIYKISIDDSGEDYCFYGIKFKKEKN